MEELDIKTLAVIINAAINFLIGAWLYLDRKGDKTNARIDEVSLRIRELDDQLARRLEGQSARIAHLEAHAEDAPTHGDLASLHEKINLVSGLVAGQGGKLDGIDATLRLILAQVAERGMK